MSAAALEKQVVRLSADCTSRGANGLSVKRAEKFARLDAGIQRFATAFRCTGTKHC